MSPVREDGPGSIEELRAPSPGVSVAGRRAGDGLATWFATDGLVDDALECKTAGLPLGIVVLLDVALAIRRMREPKDHVRMAPVAPYGPPHPLRPPRAAAHPGPAIPPAPLPGSRGPPVERRRPIGGAGGPEGSPRAMTFKDPD